MNELRCGTCGELEPLKWISVTEKLPEPMEDVLFFMLTHQIKPEICIGHFDGLGWTSCLFYNSHKLTTDEHILKITHWMPLPEYPVIKEN